MEIIAELRETKQSKQGMDNVYKLVFITENPLVMDLGKLPSDSIFQVTIELKK